MEQKDGSWASAAQDMLASSDCQGPARNVSCSFPQKEMVSPSSFGTQKGNSKERTAVPINPPAEKGFANPSNRSAGTSSVEQNMVYLLSENVYSARRPRTKRYTPLELQNHTKGPSQRNGGRLPPNTETWALAGDKPGNIDNHTPEPLGRDGDRLLISQIGGPRILGDKNDDAITCAEENSVQKECITKGGSITFNLDNEVTEGTELKELSQNPQEEYAEVFGDQNLRVHDPAVDRIKEADQLEGQRNTIQKRKRGRPRKYLAKSPEISQLKGRVAAAGMALKGVPEDYVLPVASGLPETKVNGSLPNKKNVKLGKQILNGSVEENSNSSSKVEVYSWKKDNVQCGILVPASAQKDEMFSPRRGRRPTISVNAESSYQGASQGRNAEQSTQGTSTDKVALSLQCNDQGLPFAKSSTLWKTFESMEEFRQFPQNPHFQTLGMEMEGTREGSAIALMVYFATVIKQTSTLQFDDPKTRILIDENLKILDELEQNGFDVKVVRDRLEKLRHMKESENFIEDIAKEFKDQITEKKHENLKIDDRIEEIKNQIKLLQEEQARIEASKEEKNSAISMMQSSVDGISDDVRNIRNQFESLVVKPWASA